MFALRIKMTSKIRKRIKSKIKSRITLAGH